MKKLMVLGATRYMEGFVRHALEDYEVVVVSPDLPDNITALPVTTYAVDVTDRERVLEIARDERIDGITTEQAERPVRTVAYVAEKLGLPGNPYDVACLFTDKAAMRRTLEEAGVRVLPYRAVRDAEEARAAVHEIGLPVIVKPADSRGSRGVSKVVAEDELGAAFAEASKESLGGEVVVERFVEGRELVAEGVAVNGACTTIAVGDSIPFGIENVFSPKERVIPSDLPDEVIEQVREINTRNLNIFRVRNGVSQSEYILSSDGEVYFIETCLRCGGMFVGADLTSVASGVDTADFIIKVAMGEQNGLPEVRETGKVCAYVAFYLPYGIVEDLAGLAELKALPFVRTGVLDPIELGMQTKLIVDKTARYCVVIEADGREDYERKKAEVRETLQVKVRTDEGLRGPIWD